ncbi:unnamed protein product [Lactuca virosa]|uniref:Receptor-like serine/threonine-protein kinase n=1 Tax=Lactuca virosa TaxID=75947 RepID=A0AAU9NQZ2_9ASTR|nr:unnamed protein product [Lactuca virosa]
MEVFHILVLLSTTVLCILSCSAALDIVSAHQRIKDGNTIVSAGEIYEMGFFSPGKSKNRYLGIWYKKISPCTVVWVANREIPINDASGVFEVTREGSLLILSDSNTVIWSSNSTVPVKDVNPVAQLLDNGNLVVWGRMKFGKDLITGRERYLTSWKSPDDPSVGRYKIWIDTNGYPQLFVGDSLFRRSRLGPWNGLGFRGLALENLNLVYYAEFAVNQKEIYYRYKLKSSIVLRRVLMHDGNLVQSNWIERTQEWVMYGNPILVDNCSGYGSCGPYGSCSVKLPPCNCIDGFEPRVPKEWNTGDWSSGCQRKKPLDCGSGTQMDGFQKISGVKFPDTRRSWYNVSMSLGECEMACRRNCSCTAYAELYIKNGESGSGCLLWFDALMDIREYDDNQELYIRMATSELPAIGESRFNNKKGVLRVAVSVSLAAVLLSVVVYVYRKKMKRSHKKGRGIRVHTVDKDHTSAQMENLDEVPFFSLHKIAKATDNFNIDNKIGEGGFGPVYKGVLEDGQVIVVKRLAETSQQGLDEFQNEVICIAKLQHRNLVKLLGYCIHGNEKMLIYEYMVNKSLDSFLFDETRDSMLDWPQRLHIIHGIARGILYIHQDLRLQIIHRDLKAGNILLDSEMNPKISDFGLARKFVGHDVMAKTKKVVGTLGYIPPEYAVHGRFSIKSDVFSFGVIVLEIAWRLYKEDKSIELMSASLRNSCVVFEVLRSIHIGLLCVQHHTEDRSTMLSVVLMLISEGALPQPKQPTFFTDESYREPDSVSSVDEYMLTILYAR